MELRLQAGIQQESEHINHTRKIVAGLRTVGGKQLTSIQLSEWDDT